MSDGQDYEMDSLNNLKKILAGKWDFVTMQAEEQVSLLPAPPTKYVIKNESLKNTKSVHR
jgi:hypothetical protein